MKKIAALMVLVAVVALGLAVQPASAHHRGHFWGGFAAGTATGLIVGTLAAPRPAEPAPVYVVPPPPVCRDIVTEGYWRQVPMYGDGGFVTYRNEWVPPTTQRVCQ